MTQPIVIIDNYDSFTYNIVHAVAVCRSNYVVFQNDQVNIQTIQNLDPSHIILGPGPRTPKESGILMSCIDHFHQHTPLLGICLGHQAIGEYFGATLVKAPMVQHGKESQIQHTGDGIFHSLPNPITVGRYHSLCIEQLPQDLIPLAYSSDGVLQAFKHRYLPIHGVQFHPESILTPLGHLLFERFFSMDIHHASLANLSLFSTTL